VRIEREVGMALTPKQSVLPQVHDSPLRPVIAI
jgi:hypothetical protein